MSNFGIEKVDGEWLAFEAAPGLGHNMTEDEATLEALLRNFERGTQAAHFLHLQDSHNSIQYAFIKATQGRMVVTEKVDGIERGSHMATLASARVIWKALRQSGYKEGVLFTN